MSIGRTSTFIDIYAERDLKNGTFTEEQIQEFVDHFIMKLRMVKFARTPEYQNLFSGDPQWVTESIGGMGVHGRTLVTKMSFRYLHTLETTRHQPGAQPHRLAVHQAAHGLQGVLRQGLHRLLVHPVRERRRHARVPR